MIAKNVVDREVDIAIIGGDIPIELKKNLKVERFVEDELALIIPMSHPFAIEKKKLINKIKFISLFLQFVNIHHKIFTLYSVLLIYLKTH